MTMTATVSEIATLAWGYTMADVNRIARQAAAATRYRGDAAKGQERYEDAWCGVVEQLYDSKHRPRELDLFKAGTAAVSMLATQEIQAHQIRWINGEVTKGPNFEKYWRPITSASDDDFTDRLAERLALPQLLSLLTTKEYEALVTKAAYDKPADAAHALGIDRTVLYKRVKSARTKILDAWFAPETPRTRPAAGSSTCAAGHSRAEHGIQYQRKDDGRMVWACAVCRRNQSRREKAKGDRDELRAKWREEYRARQARLRSSTDEPDAA